MGFIVKNTTFCKPIDLLCPHTCRGCGEIGSVFCKCCKNDIIFDHDNYCPICKRKNLNGKCSSCYLPPTFVVGFRDSILGKLIHDYKYNSVLSIAKDFAEILDSILPIIDGKVVIVPLPTIQKHVRARGFDHTYEIARRFAKMRGYTVQKLLIRAKNTVQVGVDKDWRILQAADAYSFCGSIDSDTTYILFDDVWTTGSSMKAAYKKLQRAGASKIILSVLAVSRVKD